MIHFSDLVTGGVPPAALRGRIAVVAATDPGIKDVLPTIAPGGEAMAGGEVQANAISTWLDDVPLRAAPGWLDAVLVLIMGLTIPLLGTRLDARRVWPIAAVLLVGFLVAAQVLFNSGLVITVVPPLVAFTLSIAVWLALAYRRADRERRQLLQRFAEGDPGVVEPVLAGETAVGGISAGEIIPGYRLEEVLGRGGMGVVYRAIDETSGRPVAVKVLAPEHAGDLEFRRRFEREARITASLEHPNVLPVYAFGEHEGIAYLVTRLVDGGDLAARLRRDGPVAPVEAVRITSAVASALDAAHAALLVHRDVKPANILLDDRVGQHVYLADFGVAHAQAATALTTAGSRVGTVAYSTPEQLSGQPADAAADTYALACVLFAMIEGRTPFERETEAATINAILHEPAPGVTTEPRLTPVLARALSRDSSVRYASAGAFAAAAAAALGVVNGAQPASPTAAEGAGLS